MCYSNPNIPVGESSSPLVKCKSSKQVTFAEVSYVMFYDDETSRDELRYSPSDYVVMRNDALKTARTIRRSIKASSTSQDASDEYLERLKGRAPLRRYTEAWKRLPKLLREHAPAVDPDELIGIEHLVIGKRHANICLALREKYSETVLAEQQYYQGQNNPDGGCCAPEVLADAAEPFTKISSSIAYSRAKHVASSVSVAKK